LSGKPFFHEKDLMTWEVFKFSIEWHV